MSHDVCLASVTPIQSDILQVPLSGWQSLVHPWPSISLVKPSEDSLVSPACGIVGRWWDLWK